MCSALVIKREALSLKTELKKSRLFSQICWHNSISNTLTAFLSAPRWRMVLLSWHRVNLMFFSWRRFSTYKTQQERKIRNLKHLSSSAKKIQQKKMLHWLVPRTTSMLSSFTASHKSQYSSSVAISGPWKDVITKYEINHFQL